MKNGCLRQPKSTFTSSLVGYLMKNGCLRQFFGDEKWVSSPVLWVSAFFFSAFFFLKEN